MEPTDRTPTLPSEDDDAEGNVERGASIGRFLVLGALGVGGMGMVLSAYDPHLDRKVALKLLRGDVWRGGRASQGHDALVREAQAMARLTHPNVVAVYEVGFSDKGAYVVMEQVEGTTLRAWLAMTKRRWDEILDVLVAAGAGLDAAHRAGIVHQDFKPENVLVGVDGRPRVSDFGLAGIAAVGAGTQGYMAPEQQAGERVDARADQYAYCVTVWQALQGERPPPDAALPASRSAPAWVYRALARGLATRPDDRWPSMEALLAALRRRSRLGWSAAIAVGAVVVAGAAAFIVGRGRATAAACDEAETRLSGVWDPARREAVRAAFASTRLPFSDATWTGVSARIDDYAQGWVAMHRDTCRATRVEGRQSDTLMDLRMACLERHRGVLGALTDFWARGVDSETLERAADAAGRLPPLAECADARALTERAPVPSDRAGPIAAARRGIDAAQALGLSRRPEGKAVAAAARLVADATGWEQVRAEADMVEADILYYLHDRGVEARALEAARLAGAARDDRLAARALILLARHLAEDQQSAARALLVADIAAGAVARTGEDPALRIQLLRSRGAAYRTAAQLDAAWTLFAAARAEATAWFGPVAAETVELVGELAVTAEARGDYPTARALTEDTLAATIALFGAEHPRVSAQLNNLGMIAWDLGDLDGCAAYHRRGLALSERLQGPESAATAISLHNLGVVDIDRGDLREAETVLTRALAIRERLLGPEHPLLASTLVSMGSIRRKQGQYVEAQAFLERALAIRTKVYGPEDANVAWSRIAIGWLFMARGDVPRAVDHFRVAVAIRDKTLGPAHRLTLSSQSDLVMALAMTGRCADAETVVATALPAIEKLVGPEHPDLVSALVGKGRCVLDAGRAAAAVALLKRAVAIAEKAKIAVVDRGAARWQLALALWAAGEHDVSIAAARRAEEELAVDGDGAHERDAVRAWLAAR